MSNEIKETKQGFLDKEMTRRQFMKVSGKTLAGVTLSAGMLSLMGCVQAQIDDGMVTVVALDGGLLVVNKDMCTGCIRCEIVCSTYNDGAASTANARLKVTRNLMSNENGVGMYNDMNDGWVCFPDTCRQCQSPTYCMDICPMPGALVNEGGVIKITSSCINCGLCMGACPWRMITRNSVTGFPTKCENCGECIRVCPTSALRFIEWDAVAAAAQERWQG